MEKKTSNYPAVSTKIGILSVVFNKKIKKKSIHPRLARGTHLNVPDWDVPGAADICELVPVLYDEWGSSPAAKSFPGRWFLLQDSRPSANARCFAVETKPKLAVQLTT